MRLSHFKGGYCQQDWEDRHVFKADPKHPGEPYCIVIPPPTVRGRLHIGHTFDNTLIDVRVRYHRMTGRTRCTSPVSIAPALPYSC